MDTQILETKTLLHILPLDEEVKKELIAGFPGKYSKEQVVELERILWRYFYVIVDLEVDSRIQIESEKNKENGLPDNLRDIITEQVVEEIKKGSYSKVDEDEVKNIRDQITTLTNGK